MSEVEYRALRRAAVVLVVLSTVRWVTTRPAPAVDRGAQDTAAAHADGVRAAAEEAARRARPLEADERIDLNRAPEEQLDRLPGVGPATARAIVEARAGGAVFRRPEDLTTVRGIGPATVEKLREALDLSRPPPGPRGGAGELRGGPAASARGARSAGGAPPGGTVLPVDLNRAGVGELVRLPGIGPVIAARIVEERGRSAFTSLDGLVRVPGIGPATGGGLRGADGVR